MAVSVSIDDLCINTVRTLAMDAVQKANSGHPGTPMALAPLGYVLWTRYLRHNPANPNWPDRDRFVLSAGHASMLLYSMLYLTGYELTLDDIKSFRQWGSKTPGHPEHGLTPGVETTTGPLGQGFGNSVGMAIAERFLAERFNRDGHSVVDHRTYVICSDGDMMEGVSSEAASLAGHLRLGKLIVFYDDNHITIEGNTALAFDEDVVKRFQAYGWHTQSVDDVNDLSALDRAIEAARAETARPSFIRVRTHIAYGSPHKQDTAEAHGAALGEDEVRATKRNLGWPEEPAFHVPEQALAHWRKAEERGRRLEQEWQERWDAYAGAFPDLAADLEDALKGELPRGWQQLLPEFPVDKPLATRSASGAVLNAVAPRLPLLVGGSADLAPSNDTYLKGYGDISGEDFSGRNLHFGVREHAMGAALNGMALHRGVWPYGGTFLIFSDYMRPSVRLASVMGVHVVYVYTHDSVGLGEDGPTHQPIEQLAALRAIPGLTVIRPADATETAVAWKVALEARTPVALALTRQKLPVLDRGRYAPAGELARGGYVLAEAPEGRPEALIVATGSEVHVALAARELLAKEGVQARVVSLPSWELFDAQPQAYRDQVLPPNITERTAVEAGSPLGWERYVGPHGQVVGLEHFGASAPGEVALKKFGFTPENVARHVLMTLGRVFAPAPGDGQHREEA